MEIDSSIKIGENAYNYLRNRIAHLLCYEGTDITEASLKKYRKKLEKKLKEMQKEIEVFRKNSLR
jgi:predicted Fe-Mo cluster-binding NifX family protein